MRSQGMRRNRVPRQAILTAENLLKVVTKRNLAAKMSTHLTTTTTQSVEFNDQALPGNAAPSPVNVASTPWEYAVGDVEYAEDNPFTVVVPLMTSIQQKHEII